MDSDIPPLAELVSAAEAARAVSLEQRSGARGPGQ